MKNITLEDINRDTAEGKLLIVAIGLLTLSGELKDKNPDEALEELISVVQDMAEDGCWE